MSDQPQMLITSWEGHETAHAIAAALYVVTTLYGWAFLLAFPAALAWWMWDLASEKLQARRRKQ